MAHKSQNIPDYQVYKSWCRMFTDFMFSDVKHTNELCWIFSSTSCRCCDCCHELCLKSLTWYSKVLENFTRPKNRYFRFKQKFEGSVKYFKMQTLTLKGKPVIVSTHGLEQQFLTFLRMWPTFKNDFVLWPMPPPLHSPHPNPAAG